MPEWRHRGPTGSIPVPQACTLPLLSHKHPSPPQQLHDIRHPIFWSSSNVRVSVLFSCPPHILITATSRSARHKIARHVSCRYPVDPSKMTVDHMQTLRNLAIQRTLNADIAKYAVMNVAYGVKNLESTLHGSSLRKATYAETGTKVLLYSSCRFHYPLTTCHFPPDHKLWHA